MRSLVWRGVTCLAAVTLLAGGSGRAAADTFAVQDLRVNTFFANNLSNEVAGWEFTTKAAVTVTRLGYYDNGADGLLTPHQVGIYDSATQQLLVSGTVGAGTTSPIQGPPVLSAFAPFPEVGAFRYVDVPPTTLPAGGNFFLAATNPLNGGNPDFSALYFPASEGMPNHLMTDPDVTILQGRSSSSAQDVLFFVPDTPINARTYFPFGPTFQFQTAPVAADVPEPGSLLLWGLTLGGLTALGRRLKKRASAA
jgi:hypothetical protein